MKVAESFIVYPAIDVYQGHCVRLFKGDYEAKTEYNANPVEVAKEFLEAGAKWLHVVDLDAAKTGGAENRKVIEGIAKVCSLNDVSVQVGGGVRTEETISELLNIGVTRCVIGTAIANIEWMRQVMNQFGGDKVVAGLDGRNGRLAVRGWLEQTEVSLEELARALFEIGLTTALVTDVEKDGTLSGPNLQLARQIQNQSGLAVLASGGVGRSEDVVAAKAQGLAGAIVGRAIYDGRIDLKSLLRTVQEVELC